MIRGGKTEGKISQFQPAGPRECRRRCQTGRELTGGEGEEVEGHVCQGDDRQHAVVSIGLDKIMTGDGCGVDVVLSEGTYEGLQDPEENTLQADGSGVK